MNNLSHRRDEDVLQRQNIDIYVGITSRENGRPSKLAKTQIRNCFENKATHSFSCFFCMALFSKQLRLI